MHIPPAFRRWGARLGLAVIVALVIGYAPGEILRRDPRTAKLQLQLDAIGVEERALAAENHRITRDINALQTSIGAIEARARADLGMVYPDEIVLRVERAPGPGTAAAGAPARAPAPPGAP
jgi:cell division protein FtsB